MKRILLTSLSLAVAVVSLAQTPIHIAAETKRNAREQIDSAYPLIRAIERAKTPEEKQLAMMTAISHLEVVSRVWPKEREQIVRAGILEADVFARSRAVRNALEVLDRVGPAAARPAQRLQIEGRRGTLLARLGRSEEAAASFASALAIHVTSPSDRMPILTDAAAFYYSQKRNADLSRVLRESATLEKNEISAATLIARSLEANMRDGNIAEGGKDYDDLARRYERVQRLPVPPFGSGEAAALQNLRAALDRFAARFGK
jgi:predicted negative regulator of RcsB-dependent stress response